MRKLFFTLILLLCLCSSALGVDTLAGAPAQLTEQAIPTGVIAPEATATQPPADTAPVPDAAAPAALGTTPDAVSDPAAPPLLTAPSGVTAGFARSQTYTGQFLDVPADSWYAANVAALFEYGLTIGKTASSYAPNDPVLLAEAAAFAARLLSQYETGDPEQLAAAYTGDSWYAPYVLLLQERGLVAAEFDGLWTLPASRAQVAHLLAWLLPQEWLPLMNGEAVTLSYAAGFAITDVDDQTDWQPDILRLYKLGLVNGVDASGSFLPLRTITRAELSAMLTRAIDPALRITLLWDATPSYSASGTTFGSLVTPPASFSTAPTTPEAIDATVRSMLYADENTLSLLYGPNVLTAPYTQSLITSFTETAKVYCEQMYNQVHCLYYPSTGQMDLTFSSTTAGSALLADYRQQALNEAIAVHDLLWEGGQITADMTQTQKARIYYQWLCEHCAYDYNADNRSLSHTAYGALLLGSAVCDGYVGAYNLLLGLEGISCRAMFNDEHIWTVAQLDGKTCYIDPTWGDGGLTIHWKYFAMTEAQSREIHGT